MALPTVEVNAHIDPKPIADAIAESITRAMTPLIGSVQSLNDDVVEQVEELVEQTTAEKQPLIDPIAEAQLQMQTLMYEKLDGIHNFTNDSQKYLYSIHFDAMKQRKNQSTLEEIRDAVRDENDALISALQTMNANDAEPLPEMEMEDQNEEVERVPEAPQENNEDVVRLLEEIADNTGAQAEAIRESSEGLDDMPDDQPATPDKPAKQTKKKGDGMFSGIFDSIKSFLKLFGKIALAIGLFAAAVFSANDSVFVKMKELFQRLVEAIAPILQLIMDTVLPPVLDILMMLADAFMQIVEALLPPIISLIEQVLPPIMDLMMQLIDVFMQIVEALMPTITKIIEAIVPLLTLAIQALAAILENVLVPIIETVIVPTIQMLADGLLMVIGFVETLLSGIVEFFTHPMSYLEDGLSYIADGGDMILSGLGDFINGIIEFIAGLVENIPFVGGDAAETLRGMKVSFGEEAKERMQTRSAERAERAYDRIAESVDFSLPREEFVDAVQARVAEGDFSDEIGSLLIEQYDAGDIPEGQKNATGATDTSDADPSPTTGDSRDLAAKDMPEMDGDKMVVIPTPAPLRDNLGNTLMVTKETQDDGLMHVYRADGSPVGGIDPASDMGKVLASAAQSEGLDPAVAADTSIDATQMPTSAEEIPTGSVAVNTATQEQEEAQSLAMASGGDTNVSSVVAPINNNSVVNNQKMTTGVIYTGGQSSLGSRDKLLPG